MKLHWSERGEGSPVVILHGLQDSERTWRRVAGELAAHHRVLALDLPGCGLSGRPDASYSLDWQARVVASWLDEVATGSVDIAAHSFGGGLAMWLLLYRARIVRRLALIAPGGLGKDVGVALRLASLPGVEGWGQPWMGVTTRVMTALHGVGLPPADRAFLRRANSLPGSSRAFARTVRDVIDCRGQKRHFLDRAFELAELPSMALFWGERDHVIPIEHGERLSAMLSNVQLHRFPRHGHFLHWTAPHELATSLLEYFDARQMPRAVLSTASVAA